MNLCNLSEGLTRNEIVEKVDEYLAEKKAPTLNIPFTTKSDQQEFYVKVHQEQIQTAPIENDCLLDGYLHETHFQSTIQIFLSACKKENCF
jgi:hypothetical protein